MTGDYEILVGSVIALFTSFASALLIGPIVLRRLQRYCREPNFSDSSTLKLLHEHKDRTPTMGGLIPLIAITVTIITLTFLGLFQSSEFPSIIGAIVILVGLALLGSLDDRTKIRTGKKGLTARSKFTVQIGIASLAAAIVYCSQSLQLVGCTLYVPIMRIDVALGIWAIPLTILVVTGTSNAVNLTDGLDGLAAGCLAICFVAVAIICTIDGNSAMTLLAVTAAGAAVGFWRMNCYPARLFMGDTGSLPLGGLLGFIAVASGNALLMIVIGGVLVAETLSVILQVASYKLRRRRVLLCAPLHHHFQFLGHPEPVIVSRFHIASLLCAIIAIMLRLL